jgi:hypothetical protein
MVGYKYSTFGITGSLAWYMSGQTFIGGGNVFAALSGRNRDAYQQRRMCLYTYIADNGYVLRVSIGYAYSGWFATGPNQTNQVAAYYAVNCPNYS